jgi:hypothetical protein
MIPPRYREVRCCWNCKHSAERGSAEDCGCTKYLKVVPKYGVCSEHKPISRKLAKVRGMK